MEIFACYHPSYITILPSISMGSDWIMLDWMFNCIEIQW